MSYQNWLTENYPNDPLTTAEEDAELENGTLDTEAAEREQQQELELFLTEND